MMKKIRVLVVDDHPTFREGLCRLLKNDKEVDCIRVAGDGEEAIKLTRELLPDVVLIDIAMPKMDGIQAAKQIKAVCPATAVIVLSAYAYDYYVLACIEAGVNGYLLKSIPHIELLNAIRMVYAGNIVFNLEASGGVLRLLTTGRDKGQEAVTSAKLHSRELQVLSLAATGITNKQIAHELGITSNTVGTHFINIFRKLGVESRTQAILYALKEGIFTLDDIVLKTGFD
jgi:NarL family two-component system response regulator LiaR